MGIFVLLQAGFLSALDAVNLKAGWHNLNLTNVNSPYSSIMEQHKILWLIPILFVAAIIAPLGAALMYCTGGSRSLFGLAVNRCAPKALVRTNKRTIPTLSIWVNLVLGMIIFLFFKGWNTMADLLTCLFAISYSIAPICMLALRFQVPNKKRPLKLPFGLLWAYIAFYICTLFIYWTGWQTIYKLIWFLLACTIIIIIFQIVIKLKSASDSLNWKASIWMWPYFAGLIFFSYIGNYGGGHGLLSDNTIMILLAIFCAVITFLAVVYKLPAHETRAHLNKVEHE